jgi:DNA-binding transcriptional ArsR family regulator
LAILDLLLVRPRRVGELTDRLGLTQPGISKHLRVLREAGLARVAPRAAGRGEASPATCAPRFTATWVNAAMLGLATC